MSVQSSDAVLRGELVAHVGAKGRRAGSRVLGVDACKAGWVGIALDDDGPQAYVAATISALVEQVRRDGELSVVGIDIPIGLPDAGRRSADVLAKAAIGSLRSSVFMTPVRPALEAPDHPTAVALNRRLAGEGASIQAFGLRTKLFEVERSGRPPCRSSRCTRRCASPGCTAGL